MISHEYQCIFIHIPRCAGTSVESWIVGGDWWDIDPSSKHMLASQAKSKYGAFWDRYFKFSVVRDPFARMRSCLKFPEHFGLEKQKNGLLNFTGYHDVFGKSVVIEHDHRFADRSSLLNDRHVSGQVYGNILDEEIDFVARFENLKSDMEFVRQRIQKSDSFDHHVERSHASLQEMALNEASVSHIATLFQHDFKRFGYAA